MTTTEWRIDLKDARVLLVNDDGIAAPGLALLERLMAPLAGEVWSIAPEREQSGTGHAFSLHQPVRMRTAGERRFAVEGTPTDAAIMALGVAMAETPPDLVISGVNRGANMGDDVTYSGTVGAAMEAALEGYPAIALSIERTPPNEAHWATVEAHLAGVLDWLLAQAWPRGVVLNVNFPDLPPDGVKGRRTTRLGRRKPGGEIVAGMDPAGRPYHWIGSKRIMGDIAPDSDVQAARDGFISMTPLRFDLTDDALLDRARERLGA